MPVRPAPRPAAPGPRRGPQRILPRPDHLRPANGSRRGSPTEPAPGHRGWAVQSWTAHQVSARTAGTRRQKPVPHPQLPRRRVAGRAPVQGASPATRSSIRSRWALAAPFLPVAPTAVPRRRSPRLESAPDDDPPPRRRPPIPAGRRPLRRNLAARRPPAPRARRSAATTAYPHLTTRRLERAVAWTP